jgi:hypothetical protein
VPLVSFVRYSDEPERCVLTKAYQQSITARSHRGGPEFRGTAAPYTGGGGLVSERKPKSRAFDLRLCTIG